MKEGTEEERKLLNHHFPDLYKHHCAEGNTETRVELDSQVEAYNLKRLSHDNLQCSLGQDEGKPRGFRWLVIISWPLCQWPPCEKIKLQCLNISYKESLILAYVSKDQMQDVLFNTFLVIRHHLSPMQEQSKPERFKCH